MVIRKSKLTAEHVHFDRAVNRFCDAVIRTDGTASVDNTFTANANCHNLLYE